MQPLPERDTLTPQREALLLLEIETAKQQIRRWPGLSAADKWAWEFLAKETWMGRRMVGVTAAAVGDYEGRTHASGMRRLENLRAAGLIAIRGDSPMYEIELVDHGDLPLKRVDWDRQLELFDTSGTSTSEPAETSESATGLTSDVPPDAAAKAILAFRPESGNPQAGEVAAEAASPALELSSPPAARRGSVDGTATGRIRNRDPVAEVSTEPRNPSRICRQNREARARATSELQKEQEVNTNTSTSVFHFRTSEERPVAEVSTEPRGISAIGDLAGAVLAGLPSADRQREWVENLIDWLKQRVGDPNLHTTPCLRLAWAVVEGRVPLKDVHGLLASLDQARAAGRLLGEPWWYFTGGVKRLLSRAESAPAWRDTGE